MLIRRACGVGLGDPAKESYLRKHFYGGLMHQENVSDFRKLPYKAQYFLNLNQSCLSRIKSRLHGRLEENTP